MSEAAVYDWQQISDAARAVGNQVVANVLENKKYNVGKSGEWVDKIGEVCLLCVCVCRFCIPVYKHAKRLHLHLIFTAFLFTLPHTDICKHTHIHTHIYRAF